MDPIARREMILEQVRKYDKVAGARRKQERRTTKESGKEEAKRSWSSKLRDLTRLMLHNSSIVTGLNKRRDIEDYAEQKGQP